ncbi:uncharacterized protein LOC107046271 [Diachasma alloeum]|uniref:uncharacterized protein LOC107046271 n=1 Tax=Diachasma alloeum TaxID=454923 RepID=UPI0007383967|nr:uncharacterized protein LOC107046271 [Diachasma alloeum]
MVQLYQDAMTIVSKFGKPDLFITMTLLAYVWVVEYQKRGLPHVHLLLTLKADHKIATPDAVDKYISAEIPDPNDDPILHQAVMKHMIHGPCGHWCKDEKGKCTKHFPKDFQEDTIMDENGYPFYRRRNTGVYNRLNGSTSENQHVVPHNRKLMKLYNCHISVEVVSSIKAVKYLYKYVTKGHDAAAIEVSDSGITENVIEHDEIRNFLETRYVSPVEACDRILSHSLQDKSHSVMRLPVHLPNQQNVTFIDTADEGAIQDALEKTTMLTDYFALNQRDLEARKFTYAEIPSHYVFKKAKGANKDKWGKAHFNVIGRMYSVAPSQIELFHLRLLLIKVKLATSFEELTTVDGQRCDTFHGACLAMGLIADDTEWERAMVEGETWMMPLQLRRLFVRILIYCHSNHPDTLWEKFKDAMSQDYQRNCEAHEAELRAYAQIKVFLTEEGSDISRFPNMPQIEEFVANIDETVEEELEQNEKIGRDQYHKLNVKQKQIVDEILKVISSNSAGQTNTCFYIDGSGGSGKTFIYTTIYHLLTGTSKSVCTMAFTGIAAILLPHGKTVHKTFGMPVPLFSDSVGNIKSQSKEAEYLKSVDVFIWDEVPMAPRYALELVDRTLRDLMNVNLPFGEKVGILGGDFRQLLPVKTHATRSEMVNLSIKFSALWRHFSMFSLTENMRALPGEAEFSKYV